MQQMAHGFSSPARSGRLRLVRTGSVLSFYVAQGADGPFQLFQRYPFSADDLKDIRIAGSTGSAQASLHARASDLRVRAGRIAGEDSLVSQGGSWLILLLALLWGSWAIGSGWLVASSAAPLLPSPPVLRRRGAGGEGVESRQPGTSPG
jgi:hypothetical protein